MMAMIYVYTIQYETGFGKWVTHQRGLVNWVEANALAAKLKEQLGRETRVLAKAEEVFNEN